MSFIFSKHGVTQTSKIYPCNCPSLDAQFPFLMYLYNQYVNSHPCHEYCGFSFPKIKNHCITQKDLRTTWLSTDYFTIFFSSVFWFFFSHFNTTDVHPSIVVLSLDLSFLSLSSLHFCCIHFQTSSYY